MAVVHSVSPKWKLKAWEGTVVSSLGLGVAVDVERLSRRVPVVCGVRLELGEGLLVMWLQLVFSKLMLNDVSCC